MPAQRWAVLGLIGLFALAACGWSPRARADTAAPSVVLHIEGMACASCSVTVRVTLTKLAGVKRATVSVEDKRAVVAYEPTKVTPQQMVAAVNQARYRASVAAGP